MEDENASFDWHRFRVSVKQAFITLPHFLKNPIEGMRQLPDWDWPTLLALQGIFAATCGVIMDLAERHLLAAIVSLFVAPIVVCVGNAVLSGFFYYTFLFYFKQRVSYRAIVTHLLFASIPVLLMSILSPFMPLIGLVGLGASAVLLTIGFTANFGLPVKPIRNLLLVMVLAYAAMLVVQLVRWQGGKETLRQRATPESLDILEKELKDQGN